MPIRFYSSLDAGAPALPNLAEQRTFDNFRIVLKACLVDGYAGKPAAGWTIGHEHPDGISFGNGDGFINLIYSTLQSGVAGYIMEAITDGSTALASGVNRRSGAWYDGASQTARQAFNVYFSGTMANKGWVVVADEYTVTIYVHATNTVDCDAYESAVLHFGRYYPHVGGSGFIFIGGSASGSVYTSSNITAADLSTSNSWSVLHNPFTGLAAQGVDPLYRGIFRGPRYPRLNPYPSFRVTQLYRVPVVTVGAGTSGGTAVDTPAFAGVLRGVMADPFACSMRFSQLWPALGGTSPATAQDKLKLLTVAGKQFLVVNPNRDETSFFVSMDEADWGPMWS